MRLVIIPFFLVIAHVPVSGQNELRGHVLDSVTRQPVPFANIYFANTSIVTMSNDKGEFTLSGFAPGKYALTVSFVGYRTAQATLFFPRTSQPIIVLLSPELTQLADLIVKPDFSQKASDLRNFEKYFIGDNSNASKCKIINEDEVVAYSPGLLYIMYTGEREKPAI